MQMNGDQNSCLTLSLIFVFCQEDRRGKADGNMDITVLRRLGPKGIDFGLLFFPFLC